jgi:two-component system, LytTR family, sensor histidine kinase AgrC
VELYSIAVFNFIIIFISLFYVMNISPTFKRLMLCFLLNLFIAVLAAEFQGKQWLPIILCIILGGSLFYLFTKKLLAFLHIINIHLIIIVIEAFILLAAAWLHLPSMLHGGVILMLLFGSLYIYKKWGSPLLSHINGTTQSKWHRYILLLSIITFFIFYLQIPTPSPDGGLQVTMLNLAVLIIYSLFLLLSYKIFASIWYKEIELKQRETERYYFYEYMTELEKTNKRMRSLQHDYSNILLSMNGYIENQDMEGLAAYFNKSISKTGKHQHRGLHQLENLKVTEVKGLIGAKLLKAQELSIAAQIEIPDKIDSIPVDIIDLSRILGIILDNAIEGSGTHEFPRLQVAFLHTQTNDLLAVIRNTINYPYPDMSRLFEESYSTKANSRGFGLYNVKQLLTKYPAITLNTYVENEWFIQEMLIERSVD